MQSMFRGEAKVGDPVLIHPNAAPLSQNCGQSPASGRICASLGKVDHVGGLVASKRRNNQIHER